MKKIITIILAILLTTNLMAQVPNYVPTNGLVAWYPFTGNAIDSSGNGNNGTVNGATLTTDRFGNANKAYSFNGISNSIDVQHSASLSIFGSQSPSTISVWFYGYTNQVEELINKGYHSINVPSYGNKFLSITNDTLSYQYTLYNFSTLNSVRCPNGYFNLQQWYQLVFVREATLKVYVNGINLSTAANNAGWSTNYNLVLNNTDMSFGCRNNKDDNNVPFRNLFFNGKIDDIGIWNRALTQQEITALYNACLNNITNITPQNNQVNIGNTATFTANTSATSPSYIWQSDLGQGFQTLNSIGKYSGTSTNNLSISNVQLTNHLDPIRAIITYGSCKDTSNIAYIKITDTCITKVTKYDTIITKITKYDTIKVMDTLVINATLSGISAPNNTNRIIVYPNPAKDHITIDYGVFSKMSGYTMKITNTLGQTVFSSPINQQSSFINLSSWTGKGVYYLQIIDPQSNMIENRKIVLQ